MIGEIVYDRRGNSFGCHFPNFLKKKAFFLYSLSKDFLLFHSGEINLLLIGSYLLPEVRWESTAISDFFVFEKSFFLCRDPLFNHVGIRDALERLLFDFTLLLQVSNHTFNPLLQKNNKKNDV